MEYSVLIIGGLIIYMIHMVGKEIIKKLDRTNMYLRLLAVKELSIDKVMEAEDYLNMK